MDRGDIVSIDTKTIRKYIDLGVITRMMDDRGKAQVEDLLRSKWREVYILEKLDKVGELNLSKIKRKQMSGPEEWDYGSQRGNANLDEF